MKVAGILDFVPWFLKETLDADWKVQRARAGLSLLHYEARRTRVSGTKDPAIRALSEREITRLQAGMRASVAALFEPLPKRLVKSGEVEAPLAFWMSPGAPRRVGLVRSGGRLSVVAQANWPDTIWLGWMDVLADPDLAWRRCLVCGALFLRTKRQEYCGAPCAQRARYERWYAGNRDAILKKRRGEYEARVETSVGPKARVRPYRRRKRARAKKPPAGSA